MIFLDRIENIFAHDISQDTCKIFILSELLKTDATKDIQKLLGMRQSARIKTTAKNAWSFVNDALVQLLN